MKQGQTALGLFLMGILVGLLATRYLRTPKTSRFRPWGWAGLGIILTAEGLLFHKVQWAATFFTPLAWTGYLLFVDALVSSLKGESRLTRSPKEFLSLAFWSVPLWLIFEAYNLRLANWAYVGLPESSLIRAVGYVWSFATIWPAIFGTADLMNALCARSSEEKPRRICRRPLRVIFVLLGFVLVTVPVLVPAKWGQYLFGAVWVGFIFLLDPIIYRWNGRSLIREWEGGQSSTLESFLLAGLVCGFLWEFWNYWASAKWLYVFRIGQSLKVFEMPLLGYLGFPPFALESFVMYEFLRTLKMRYLPV